MKQVCQEIIKHVIASATESELATLYNMAQEAVYAGITLEEMGHKQSPTPLQTANAMAEPVRNGKIQPKRTKSMNMGFHWLRDRERQKQFRKYWRPGKLNYADYLDKIPNSSTPQEDQKRVYDTKYSAGNKCCGLSRRTQ